MGEPFYRGLIHDHSKLLHDFGHPNDTALEEQEQILNLSPKLKKSTIDTKYIITRTTLCS